MSSSASTTAVEVSGMTCSHCVGAVTSELTQVDGVTAVHVDLATGTVEITSDRPVPAAVLAAAVEAAGYELVP
jgi:copper chaperone